MGESQGKKGRGGGDEREKDKERDRERERERAWGGERDRRGEGMREGV